MTDNAIPAVRDLITRSRALADEVQRFVAGEPDDRGFGAAASRMADAVASAPDAEWAAYEARIMLSSVAGGLSQLFGGGNDAVGQRSDSLRATMRAVQDTYSSTAVDLDAELRAWQETHAVTPQPREGRPV
ncbi:MAG: hypothetical protein L0G99_13900 [Propionibacteriales bacterium]|nr:hypothetical protein [Propionibacteriales bacterium]